MTLSFSASVRQFIEKTNKRTHMFVNYVLIELAERLVYGTPVGDPKAWRRAPPPGYMPGRARGGWAYSPGRPGTGVLTKLDTRGGPTVAAIARAIPAEAAGKVHYLYNNVPYIVPLELGYSRQAPAGMAEQAVLNFGSITQNAQSALQAAQMLGLSR